MKSKIKNLLIIIFSVVFVFGFLAWSLILPDKATSTTERRPLKQFPKISSSAITSGTFMSDFDSYTLDQFPLRDNFRSLKSITSLKVFNQKDNNDLFVREGHIFKIDYPASIESVDYAAKVFANINEQYLNESNNVYLSIIPDKNYYITDKSGLLLADYDLLINSIKDKCDFAKYIDISDTLTLDDFYKTDSHWKQENIEKVADRLLNSMNAQYVDTDTRIVDTKKDFYGVYHGQLGLDLPPDNIKYLLDDAISNAVVFNYENKKQEDVYNLEKLNDVDPYEMYLSGPVSLLTIENKLNADGKELVIFRDSFTSSLAPLLLKGYSKITLVDIRYLNSETLAQFVDFENKDVLFLYSSSVINNSDTLK